MQGRASGERARKRPLEILRHRLRFRIVAAGNQREVTPKEFTKRTNRTLRAVHSHFQALHQAGYLRPVREEVDRGLRRIFYRAERLALVTDDEFATMTGAEQSAVTAAVVLDLIEHLRDAFVTGALDAWPDSHLTWFPLRLDEQARQDLLSAELRLFEYAYELEAEALVRLRKSGEDPIPTTGVIGGFKSPPQKRR